MRTVVLNGHMLILVLQLCRLYVPRVDPKVDSHCCSIVMNPLKLFFSAIIFYYFILTMSGYYYARRNNILLLIVGNIWMTTNNKLQGAR